MNKKYQLETLTCPSCVAKIEGMLSKTKGIIQSSVRFNTSRVMVEFDESEITSKEITKKIYQLGYEVIHEK